MGVKSKQILFVCGAVMCKIKHLLLTILRLTSKIKRCEDCFLTNIHK